MSAQKRYLEVIEGLCSTHESMPVYGRIHDGNTYCYLYDNQHPGRAHRTLEKIPNAPYWAECNISTPQKALSVFVIMVALNCDADMTIEKVKYIISP